MAVGRIATYPAAISYESAWNAPPLQSFPPPWWSSISARALGPWSTEHGSDYWLARTTAGTLRPVLDNRDGALDTANTASPYAPNVTPGRGLRIRQQFGVNQLTPDQAEAGEASGILGAIPPQLNIVNDFGYPLTIAASATAYQGTQVYQAVLPSGAAAFSTVLLAENVPVIPRAPYSFQAQCRITGGNSVSTQAVILWFDASGNSLSSSTVSGTAQTLTSGSSTWVQLSAATGAAPSGAYSAQLKVQIAAGTLTGSTTWQIDGLQWEQSAYPTPWTAPGTLGANLLPQPIATGTASINPTSDSAGNYFAAAAGSVAQAFNLTAAPTGSTTALAWTSPAGTTNTSALLCGVVGPLAPAIDGPVADCVQVAAGLPYSTSVYLTRAASADTTVQTQVQVKWYGAAGNLLGTFNGSSTTLTAGSWARATLPNLTAPTGAMWARVMLVISSPAPTTATNVVYSTGWQFEQSAAASTWVDPGPTYFAWTGYWDQFPQTWRLSGTWGETQASGVDALAGLAQYTVLQPFVEELLALGPDFFYQLNDPAGSTSVADTAGKRPAAPVESSPAGAGSLVLGSAVTAAAAGQAFLGTGGPVAALANNPAGSGGSAQEAETFVSIHKSTPVPGPPANGPWTRIIHFRAPAIPASGSAYTFWMALPSISGATGNLSAFSMGTMSDGTGRLNVNVSGSRFTGVQYSGQGANVCDGNWHQVAMTVAANGATVIYVDGSAVAPNGGLTQFTPPISNIASDVLGAYVQFGAQYYNAGMVGDLACAVEFPAALTAAQITNLYGSWRTASSGESSGARVKRLLGWVGWPGATAIDTGSTTSMGPATDLAGQAALSGFNAIVDTEGGDGFAANNGAITFKGRAARYNSAPAFIFGEGPPAGHPGEWPYAGSDGDLQVPTDLANTYNIIPTQQYSTGQVATAQDTASQQAIWPRTLPARTINSTSYAEVQAAGQYLLGQLKTPRPRLAGMLLDVGSVPGLWRVAAQLEKGVRIRVFKRPPGRAPSAWIQFDGFVERTEWTVDPRGGGSAVVRVEASPADLASYWVLAALRTTLAAQAASGQATAKINALPDSAVNALASSLPQGYQLTFDPGTAIAETMTLAATGIPATTPGYSTATLTFTSNFAHTHAAGAIVCEPLPAGYTDPTTWDAASTLGAAYATTSGAQSSGQANLTITALGDAKTNAPGSNYTTGDVIWIGPGASNFEGYNLLHPNAATAGEGVLPLAAGTTGGALGLASDLGTPTITASATAWQGANVWQVSVTAGASTPSGLLYVLKVPAAAALAFTASVYVRCATSSQNPTVFLYVKYLDASGNSLGQFNSGNSVLTGSPTAAWTRLAATGTAPAGTVWVQMGVLLTGTAPSGAWSFQADGLQVEQAGSASAYQTAPQVKSVASSVPGYTTVTITLAQNLVNSHAAGEWVCDPLTPGGSDPTLVPGTARLAY